MFEALRDRSPKHTYNTGVSVVSGMRVSSYMMLEMPCNVGHERVDSGRPPLMVRVSDVRNILSKVTQHTKEHHVGAW